MRVRTDRWRRPRLWRRVLVLAAAAAMLAACGGASGEGGGTPTLNWYIFPEPSGSFKEAAADCSAASGGEYTIVIQDLPSGADDQREQLVRRSSARSRRCPVTSSRTRWPTSRTSVARSARSSFFEPASRSA